MIEDYRRIVGVPEEPRATESSSSTAQSAPVRTSEHSSNLSSLIDLDISGSQAPSTTNGNMLSNDLQDLGRLSRYRISVFTRSKRCNLVKYLYPVIYWRLFKYRVGVGYRSYNMHEITIVVSYWNC